MDELSKSQRMCECVQPELGELLWQRDRPDFDNELRRSLENHLIICEACRLRQAMERRLPETLARQQSERPAVAEITEPSRIPRRHAARRRSLGYPAWASVGGLTLAASLALMLILPPRPRDEHLPLRAADSAPFHRPIEGQLLTDRTPRLAWPAIDGAHGYLIAIEEVDGDFAWKGETDEAWIQVPAAKPLPTGSHFRAILRPTPLDLAPASGLSVSFRTGGSLSWMAYRLSAAPATVRWLGLAGLTAMIVSLTAGFWQRRPRPGSR